MNTKAKLTDPTIWTTLFLTTFFDQATKWIVIERLSKGESWPEHGLFRFTHAWNTGTAFSLFQGQGELLMWVSLAAVIVVSCIYRSIINPPRILRFAFGLQLGGALGNLTDRFRLGHVTDFIDVGWWPVFNIADTSIVVGIGLMVLYFWFLENRSPDSSSEDQIVSKNSSSDREPAHGGKE